MQQTDPASEDRISRAWGDFPLPLGVVQHWILGDLALWTVREQQEVRIHWQHLANSEEEDQTAPEPPDQAQWARWAIEEGDLSLRFSPQFPDRPIVARPLSVFYLPVEGEARIYIRVPLFVRLELIKGPRTIDLVEIPSIVLSNTWFGNLAEGELCYWLPTSARRRLEEENQPPHLVICPLQIENSFHSQLEVSDICLRIDHLSVFKLQHQLWANETRVSFRGHEEVSAIRISDRPPPEAVGASRITPPRTPIRRTFAARTFATLRTVPGLRQLTE